MICESTASLVLAFLEASFAILLLCPGFVLYIVSTRLSSLGARPSTSFLGGNYWNFYVEAPSGSKFDRRLVGFFTDCTAAVLVGYGTCTSTGRLRNHQERLLTHRLRQRSKLQYLFNHHDAIATLLSKTIRGVVYRKRLWYEGWCYVSFDTRLWAKMSNVPELIMLFSFIIAPSFVPRHHGVVSHIPKNVIASQVYGSKSRKTSSGAASVKMMPIGVPKVAYRVPGSQQADW
jgi:hypothetical protein